MPRLLNRTIAVLSFHKIGAPSDPHWDSWFYIPENVFAAQLEWLRKNEWSILSMEQFLRGLADPGRMPERAALLTFDDGYQSMATVALCHLQAFGYSGVVFVPTSFIGGVNAFDLDNEPEERMCTWNELRELEAAGVSVQSHGVTHRSFSALSPAAQGEEIQLSKSILEDGLQKPVVLFAFPYGDAGSPGLVGDALSGAGYRAAFLYAADEPYQPDCLPFPNPFRIDRLAVGPDTDFALSLGERAVRSAQ